MSYLYPKKKKIVKRKPEKISELFRKSNKITLLSLETDSAFNELNFNDILSIKSNSYLNVLNYPF
jgi:hypothetical protein